MYLSPLSPTGVKITAQKCLHFLKIIVIITIVSQAEIAQSVEHFTRNEGVVGSSPIFSFTSSIRNRAGA